MDTALLVALVAALVLGAVAARERERARARERDDAHAELAALRADLARMGERLSVETRVVSERLEGIDSRMSVSQGASTELAHRIFDTLGEVRSATSAVAEQARQFSSLQDLLKPPKARGGIGEAMLAELLRQVLPPQSFALQHRFSSGAIVDAVVRAGGKLVCIDSKFPLANYHRMLSASDDAERAEAERAFAADVDAHIRAIGSRYVVPDEGTFDFAVMYVPAEGVYAEVLRLSHRRRPLFETAIEARVVPMSPLTMYGYLQTVLFGLKCLSIEQSARDVLDFCGRLQQDLERFADEYQTLGRHLGNARAKYEEGARRLDRFRDKLDGAVDLAATTDDAAASGPRPVRPPLEAVGE